MTKRRWIYYLIGLFILALGLELNSKTGLGVSAIISVAYANSVLFGIAFPDMTLILYIIFVLVELIIHTIRKQPRQVLVMDVLQIPLSIVFTRFMKVYELFIPDHSDRSGRGHPRDRSVHKLRDRQLALRQDQVHRDALVVHRRFHRRDRQDLQDPLRSRDSHGRRSTRSSSFGASGYQFDELLCKLNSEQFQYRVAA